MLDFPSAGISEWTELVIPVKTGILSLQDWLDLGEALMNRFLASALRYLNAMVGFLILLTCAISGGLAGAAWDEVGFGFFLGSVTGVIIAVVVCGFTALLLDIRNTVRNILVELRDT